MKTETAVPEAGHLVTQRLSVRAVPRTTKTNVKQLNRNMNATRIINTVPQTELPELKAAENFDELRQPARSAAAHAWLRRGVLIGIALLLVSLVFAILNSIYELDAQMETAHANMTSQVSVSTK